MNLEIELKALTNRYSDQIFYTTYEIAKQIAIFLKRYGGKYSIYAPCEKIDGKTMCTIAVEYRRIFSSGEYETYSIQSIYYVPLSLRKVIRNKAHWELIYQEITDIIEGLVR